MDTTMKTLAVLALLLSSGCALTYTDHDQRFRKFLANEGAAECKTFCGGEFAVGDVYTGEAFMRLCVCEDGRRKDVTR